MLNIRSLLLGNFRIFNEPATIKLAPFTILTGTNGCGKSSIARSLLFMKGLDTGKLPFRLRLDSGKNPFGSFEMIINNKSGNKHLSVGYGIYNIVLGENVSVQFALEKAGDFDAVVRNISITSDKGNLFDFNFDRNKITSRIGIKNLYDKLLNVKKSKNLYTELERKFRDIRRASGSYSERPVAEKDGFENGQIRIFRVDKELKTKNILTYLERQNISTEECRRLFYVHGNRTGFPGDNCGEDEYAERLKKALDDFRENDILFDNKLLKRILEIPGDELSSPKMKAVLKAEFPDLYDCLVMLKSDSANLVIDLLKEKNYDMWEKEFIENEIVSTRRMTGSNVNKELSGAIEHHLQVMFEKSPFFRAVTDLSATREGFLQAYNNYRNLKGLASFCALVLEKIISDLETDLEMTFPVAFTQNTGVSIDFRDPMHDLIRKYSENGGKDDFLDKWFSEFKLCDDLSLQMPVNGLGFFPGILRDNESISLSNEGSGAKRLLMMLLSIAGGKQHSGLKDFNDDPVDYPRTVILESPETNLHPSWQSKLADMLVDAGKQKGLHFLIETHSVQLVERLQYLASKGKIRRDDLIIYSIGTGCSGEPLPREVKSADQPDFSLGRAFPDEDASAMELFRLKKINNN